MGEPPFAPLDEHVVLLDLEDGREGVLFDIVVGQEVLLQLRIGLALYLTRCDIAFPMSFTVKES